MKFILLFSGFIFLLVLSGCKERQRYATSPLIIAGGQMPSLVIDNAGMLNLVYGTGDSIMYCYSTDKGISFSNPALIKVLDGLVASHTRGPQVAAWAKGLTVIACNRMGNIFSYLKDSAGNWKPGGKVNDIDTVSKEALMALSGQGQNCFAVWLDVRDGHNKIFGAKSSDGGKTWLKNIMIYSSPDKTVCECCKPSVLVKGDNVYVMFRNWLNGNRDMYLAHSADGGIRFGQAEKLGKGSWALNGCPMDGGALALDKDGHMFTFWRREGKLFSCEPGMLEKEIGVGTSGTIEIVAGREVYAWTEKGKVVCLLPDGKKQVLGKGQLPILKAVNDRQFICVWEDEKQIHRAILAVL